MHCTNCGTKLEDGARFCQKCGHPVLGTNSDAIRTIDVAQASGRHPRPRTMIAIISVLSVIAIAAIAFAVVTLLGNQAQSSQAPSASAPASAQNAGEPDGTAGGNANASLSSASAQTERADISKSSDASSASDKSDEPEEAEKSEEGFDKVAAESQARKDARAAGMQVFSGTVRITNYADRAAEISPSLARDFSSMADEELALLDFSISETVSAASAGDMGRVQTRAGQDCIALTNPWEWEAYDGQLVTVAAYAEDLMFPSDVAGALYSARGSALLIAPLTEESAANLAFEPSGAPEWIPADDVTRSSDDESGSSAAATPPDGDYILPDSATRRYAKSELEKLSNHDLFIARNEIYARHGRQFQSDELKRYFSSKSWYHGTTPAASFNESVLNDTELANVETMIGIEQSRGSQYL